MPVHSILLAAREGLGGWWGQTILQRDDLQVTHATSLAAGWKMMLQNTPQLFIAEETESQSRLEGFLSDVRCRLRIPSLKGILVTPFTTPALAAPPVVTLFAPPPNLIDFNKSVAGALGLIQRAGPRHLLKMRLSLDSAGIAKHVLVSSLSINLGGMLIESSAPLKVGTDCYWSFMGVPDLKNIVIPGTILRENEKPPWAEHVHVYVVKFSERAEGPLQRLAAYLNKLVP